MPLREHEDAVTTTVTARVSGVVNAGWRRSAPRDGDRLPLSPLLTTDRVGRAAVRCSHALAPQAVDLALPLPRSAAIRPLFRAEGEGSANNRARGDSTIPTGLTGVAVLPPPPVLLQRASSLVVVTSISMTARRRATLRGEGGLDRGIHGGDENFRVYAARERWTWPEASAIRYTLGTLPRKPVTQEVPA